MIHSHQTGVHVVDVVIVVAALDVQNAAIIAVEDVAAAVTAIPCRFQSPLEHVLITHVVSAARSRQRKVTASGLACGPAVANAKFPNLN